MERLPVSQIKKKLAVIVDNSLSCSFYITEITSKLVKSTYQLARIKHFIDDGGQKMFYHVISTINLSMEYCFLGCCCSSVKIPKIPIEKSN